jgi:hypothetical protein
MAFLIDLWLPIVLSAVAVFIVSSVLHMVLKYHMKDYRQLANEGDVLAAMRAAGVTPGDYHFPWASDMKALGTDEMQAKFAEGPVGLMTVRPSGIPNMGKHLAAWFAYSLVVGVFVAYIASRTLAPDAHYLAVFRVVGATAFLAYGGAQAQNSIWRGQSWATTLRHTADSLVYGLFTGGVFGWLWG